MREIGLLFAALVVVSGCTPNGSAAPQPNAPAPPPPQAVQNAISLIPPSQSGMPTSFVPLTSDQLRQVTITLEHAESVALEVIPKGEPHAIGCEFLGLWRGVSTHRQPPIPAFLVQELTFTLPAPGAPSEPDAVIVIIDAQTGDPVFAAAGGDASSGGLLGTTCGRRLPVSA